MGDEGVEGVEVQPPLDADQPIAGRGRRFPRGLAHEHHLQAGPGEQPLRQLAIARPPAESDPRAGMKQEVAISLPDAELRECIARQVGAPDDFGAAVQGGAQPLDQRQHARRLRRDFAAVARIVGGAVEPAREPGPIPVVEPIEERRA